MSEQVLSFRQLHILRGTAAGLSTNQIAAEQHIAPSSVRTHKALIFEKLGVHSGAEAVAVAYRRGILALDPGVIEAAALLRAATALGCRLALVPWASEEQP